MIPLEAILRLILERFHWNLNGALLPGGVSSNSWLHVQVMMVPNIIWSIAINAYKLDEN